MGIGVWVPRSPLPHAPAPRWLPEQGAERHEHISLASSEHARPVAASDLMRVGQPMVHHEQPDAPATTIAPLPKEPHTAAEAAPLSPEAPPESITPADMTPPRFRLEFMRVSAQGIWVVDGAQNTEAVQRLIYRVMSGMRQPQDFIPQPVSFRWPFIESRHEDQSTPVALQALGAQWQFLKDQGVSYVITLGQEAKVWMERTGVTPAFHAEGVEAILTSANNKRALWQVLRHLPEL